MKQKQHIHGSARNGRHQRWLLLRHRILHCLSLEHSALLPATRFHVFPFTSTVKNNNNAHNKISPKRKEENQNSLIQKYVFFFFYLLADVCLLHCLVGHETKVNVWKVGPLPTHTQKKKRQNINKDKIFILFCFVGFGFYILSSGAEGFSMGYIGIH